MRRVKISISVIVLMTQTILYPAFSYPGLFARTGFKLPYISFGERPEKMPDGGAEGREAQLTSEGAQAEIDLSQPLTLKQCIQIAIDRAPSMRSAKLNIMSEEINVKDAQSGYFPQVDVNGRYMFSDAVDFGWEKENYDASVTAGYTIWDHGQRRNSLDQAKLRRDAEYSRYQGTRQSLIFDVIRAYYDLLEAEKLIAVDEQLLEQSRQNVEKVKAFVSAGYAIEADIATARVQQANSELAVINDRNNLELARANLADLMGLEPGTKFSIVDDPEYEGYMQAGLIETEEVSVEELVSSALERRSEIAQMNANIAVLESALKLAELERWPRITAESQYNIRLDDYLRERDVFKNHRSWNVSARADFPLFDGGRSRRAVKKAEIALQKMNENMSELKRNITLEVHQAYLNLERTKKSLDIARFQVEDAKMSLDVAQGRYEQRMIILLELLSAQTRYAEALTDQVKAFYNYKVAKKTLEKAIGVL